MSQIVRIARPETFRHILLAACLGIFSLLPVVAEPSLKLTGRVTVPHGFKFGKTTVGGLSGISYDAASDSFWAVSDDSAYKGGPPRVYQLRLNHEAGHLESVDFLRVLPLRDAAGRLFPVADPEGIACTGKGGFWVSSEGKGSALPWVRLFDLKTGKTLRTLPLPSVYLPVDAAGKPVKIGHPTQVSGVIGNKSLESCALSPDLRTVYTASETSLLQEKMDDEDEGGAGLFHRTWVRISALNARTGQCLGQKLYLSDAGCLFGSISEIMALNNSGRLWVLERRVIGLFEGPGSCQIRIYEVEMDQPGTTDLRNIPKITSESVVALPKKLIFDSKSAGLEDVDNLEGICLAPRKGGGQMLIAVSDNNFNPKQQTQILSFQYSP